MWIVCFLCCALALIASGFAKSADIKSDSPNGTPLSQNNILKDDLQTEKEKLGKAKCCYPKEFEMFIFQTTHQGPATYIYLVQHAVDSGKQITAGRSYDPSDFRPIFRSVSDYAAKVLYIIDDETCFKVPLDDPWPENCIPDRAELVGNSYHGIGDDILTLDTWKYSGVTPELEYTNTVSITDECWPVTALSELHFAEFGTQYVHTNYVNGTASIVDQSLFDIPSDCSGETLKIPPKMPSLVKYKFKPF